jgi:peptide/nickel transport system substrate-binding protein
MLGPAAALAATLQPASAQDVRDTLRVAMYQNATPRGNVYGIQYIWPHSYWWEAAYDSFVRIDDKAQVLPFTAEKWGLVNPTTWRVTFRKDVEFNSGRKNDAANVVKAFEYLHSDAAKGAGIMRNMKLTSYKAIDSHTVEFVTTAPDPLFVPKLAAFYTIDMASFAEMGAANFANKPVTSGPFRVLNWTDQEMTAVAFDKAWRPAKTKNLRLLNVPETATRVAAIESGEIDIAYNLGPDDMSRIRAAGHQVAVEPAPFVATIAMFTEDFAKKWNGKPPFADKRVRLAANLAVNRQAMANDLLRGMTKAGAQPATPATFGYNPAIQPYPYDVNRAKQLLAEAGYGNGLSILMETSAVVTGATDFLQVMADDLRKVGINVKVNVMPFAERSRRYNNNSWEGDMTSFTYFFSPMMDASIPFTTYGCDIANAYTCIPSMTPLVQAQEKEMDRGKRLAILQQLMQAAHDEAMALPLFDGFDITGLSKRVKGYKNWNKIIHYDAISIDG